MPALRLLGASLRRLAGASELRVPGGEVGEVLEAWLEGGAAELEALVFDAEETRRSGARALGRDLKVLVNGRSIEFLAGLRTPVGERDTISLFLAGARGWPGG